MKSLSLVALALLSLTLTVPARAQTGAAASSATLKAKMKRDRRPNSGFRVVPMIGAGSSFFEGYTVNDETALSIDRRTGFTGGVLVEYGRGLLSGQTGVLFFQEGMIIDQEGPVPIGPGSTSFNKFNLQSRLDYVGFPLLGKINLRTKMATYYFKGGVIPAAVVAGELRAKGSATTADGATQTIDTRVTSGGNTRSVNVFGNAAVGISAPISRTVDVRIETAYNRALLPINTGDAEKLFTNSFTLMVGAGFSL